jgi:hypothetical protein
MPKPRATLQILHGDAPTAKARDMVEQMRKKGDGLGVASA